MSYYMSARIEGKTFDETVVWVTECLKTEGFGVLTEIDVADTLQKKIGVDFKKYKILGACNPHFAHQALLSEDKIGVLLPCNFVVEEHENGDIEVSAVDPLVSMGSVDNAALAPLAADVKTRLDRIIQSLNA